MKKAVFAAALLLCGCAAKTPEKHTRELFAMDTYMSLTAYDGESGSESAEAALSEAVDFINALERELSVTLSESDISVLNSASGERITVGSDALSIISTSLEISSQTDGALDITVYPLVREWGFTTGEYRIPEDEVLQDLLQNVGYGRISVEGQTVALAEGTEIDLGALAKGYAGSRAVEILRVHGVTSAILDLGGNVCAVGKKPDGTAWRVAVADPDNSSEYLGILDVEDKFVVTSGKYERYFTGDDGKRYHHIIDPKTGKPSENGLNAVTVIGTDGTKCDALSTALLVMGEERAVQYWREYGDFDMLLVTDDRRLLVTDGISDGFRLTSDCQVSVIE